MFLLVLGWGSLQAATLDPTFNLGLPQGARVITSIMQPDAKILVGGNFAYTGTLGLGRGVARLNPDGSLDTTFQASVLGSVEYIYLQEDGKIIVANSLAQLSVGGGAQRHLLRLNSDGSLDTTYTPVVGYNLYTPQLNAIALQRDGKLLIAGSFTHVNGATKSNLARLLIDGSLDTAFSPEPNGVIDTISLRDDKVYTLGSFSQIGGISRGRLARLGQDGTCDASFTPVIGNEYKSFVVKIDGSVRLFYSGSIQFYHEPDDKIYYNPGMHYQEFTSGGALSTSGFVGNSLFKNKAGLINFGQYYVGVGDYPYDDYLKYSYIDLLGGYAYSYKVITGATAQEDNRVIIHHYDNYEEMISDTICSRIAQGNFSPTLQIDSSGLIKWLRGSIPPTEYAKFQVSYDDGNSWSDLGYGTYSNNGWQYSLPSLPDDALVRVRGASLGGHLGLSQGMLGRQVRVGAEILILENTQVIPDGSTSTTANTQFSPTLVSPANAYQTKTYTIRNAGSKELNVTSVNVSGAHASDFQVVGLTLPTTVSSYSSKGFLLRFNPTALGTRTATVTVTNSDGTKGSYDFVVSGEGVEAEINLKGNHLDIVDGDASPSEADGTDFGPAVNASLLNKTFTVENTGSGPLTVSSINLSGANASNFSVSQITDGPIAPGQSKTFNVFFYPSSPFGARYATVTIHSDDENESSYDFVVKGEGIEPEINLKGNSVNIAKGDTTPSTTDGTDYGPAMGVAQIVKTFTVENTGVGTLTVSSIQLNGANAADFAVTQITGSSISPGQSKTFNVVFYPSRPSGARYATVTIHCNDVDEASYDFAIKAEGIEPEINLKGNGVNIVKGDTTPSTTDGTDYGPSAEQLERIKTFRVENTGSGPLAVSSIVLSGANASDFGVTQISGNIPPGESRDFNVILYPSSPGLRTATVTINNDDADEGTYAFAIVGQGVEPWQIPQYAVQFSTPQSIPITTSSLVDVAGHELDIALSFAPQVGTNLMIINNTGLSFISGSYVGMAQGDQVILSYGSLSYLFVVNYYGGDGNDLVLHWAGTKPYAWGENSSGRLGDNSDENRTSPVAVNTSGVLAGKTIIKVVGGGSHSLALCSDGTIAAWGSNGDGQLGINSTTSYSFIPVLVDKTNGVSALYNRTVVDISAGNKFSLALCSDGKVVAWGDNSSRQCGDAATTSADRRAPVLVDATTSALNGKKVVRIATNSSSYHTLALCSDGTLVAWGRNSNKCLGNNSSETYHNVPVLVNTTSGALAGKQVISMATGEDFSLASCSDNTIAAWGENANGRLGTGNTTDTAIPVNTSIATLLDNGNEPDWTIKSLVTGETHSLLIRSDGAVIAWGYNSSYSKLGTNDSADALSPIFVNTVSGISALHNKSVIAVSAGELHSYALCSDGTMAGWGHNNVGQLATGSVSPASRKVPTAIVRGSLSVDQRLVSISSGFDHAQALVASPQAVMIVESPNDVRLSEQDTLDFGQVFYSTGVLAINNTQNSQTIRIENQGSITLSGLSFSKLNDASSSYQVSSYLPASLEPGQYGNLVVNFKPTTSGTQTAVVRVTATIFGVAKNFDIQLTGTGSDNNVAAVYLSGSEVPVIASSLNAAGKTVTLDFAGSVAPSTIKIVELIDSLAFISGFFSNLPDGEITSLSIGGQTYHYLVNYYGGTGNDLVLERLDVSSTVDADTDDWSDLHEFLYFTNRTDHKSFTRPVNWGSLVNSSTNTSDGSLNKTSGTAGSWDTDAVSQVKFIGNSMVSFSAESGSELAVGLSAANVDRHYTAFSHAVKLTATGAAVYESGVLKKDLGGYGPKTIFAIRRTSESIEYLKNRKVVYSSSVPSSGTALVDSSLSSASAEINSAYIQSSDLDNDGIADSWEFSFLGTSARWADILAFTGTGDLDEDGLSDFKEYYFGFNASDTWSFMRPVLWSSHRFTEDISGDSGGLTKNARPSGVTEDAWDADAVAWQVTKAGSATHFRLAENAAIAVGLSTNNSTASNSALNYAIVTTTANTAAVYESGVLKFDLGTYDSTTWFSIVRASDGQIQYQKNRQTLHSTASPTTAEMQIDTSFFTLNGSVLEALVYLPGDQDQDGMPDSWERQHITGTATTGWEALIAFQPDGDEDDDALQNLAEYQAVTRPFDADSDNDNLPDGWEISYAFNPLKADENNNGILDGLDDFDYLDGLTNAEEVPLGTNPRNPDTDGDGLFDGWEAAYGLDPLDPDQDNDEIIDSQDNFDTDLLLNFQEYLAGTSPWLADSDDDGVSDDEEFYPDFPADMDADGDGISDEDEIAAGSDPEDWRSTPLIQFQVTTPLR